MSLYDNTKYQYIKKLCKKGNYDKALNELETYMLEYPNDLKVNYLYAIILEKNGNKKKALDIYKQIIDENNDIECVCGSLYRLAQNDLNEGKYDDAEEKLRKTIEIGDHSEPHTYITLAKIIASKTNYKDSLKLLNEYELENDEIYFAKAYAYFQINQIDKAYNELDKISNHSDISMMRKIYSLKAQIEMKINDDYYKAKDYYKRSLVGVRDEQYYKILLDLATLERKYRMYEEGFNICYRIISEMPKLKYSTLFILGDLFYDTRKFDNAFRIYKDILKYNKNADKIYNRMGVLMVRQDRYDDAICYFKKIQEGSLYYQKAQDWLTICYIRKEKYNEAAKHCHTSSENFRLKFLINKKLGKNVKPICYTECQIASYSLSAAINHVMREHKHENIISYFKDDVCIESIFIDVLNKINDDNIIQNELYITHRIPYDNIGYSNNKEANCLDVVVEKDTNRIITMYPVYDIKTAEENYKKESRIDKFNKKYGLIKK